MNGVADSSSLNKPNKNKFKYMHAYFFIFYMFIFLYFPFFIFYFFWAGLDPASPAWSLAQASDPAGPHEARVIQITRAWPLLINSKQAAKMN